MHRWWRGATLLISLAIGTAGSVFAQGLPAQPPQTQRPFINEDDVSPVAPPAQPAPARKQKKSPVFEHDPDLDASDQLAPSQIDTSMPGAVSMPTGGSHTRAAARGTDSVLEPGTLARQSRPAAKPQIIACSGLFGPDSSHAKLAAAFRSKNVGLTQVDANSGAKVMATVLFAKDPKQRLEIWWSNQASRSATHLIVINGQSDWIAPGELHLGLTLAELEQLNGKPLKLSGFDKNNVATLTDWNGGQLSTLAGGCKIGISLRADPKAPTALGDLPADRVYSSNDAALRAVNPAVSEILIAY
jgi:hypothetical protein